MERPSEQMAHLVRDYMQSQRHTLAVLESVTGGLVAHALTNVAASGYLIGGAIPYDQGVKERFGVSRATIDAHGIVSGPVAEEMAKSAARWFQTCHGLGVTGAAGPEPESDGTEPGIAYAAVWSQRDGILVVPICVDRTTDRTAIKREIAERSVEGLLHYLNGGHDDQRTAPDGRP